MGIFVRVIFFLSGSPALGILDCLLVHVFCTPWFNDLFDYNSCILCTCLETCWLAMFVSTSHVTFWLELELLWHLTWWSSLTILVNETLVMGKRFCCTLVSLEISGYQIYFYYELYINQVRLHRVWWPSSGLLCFLLPLPRCKSN